MKSLINLFALVLSFTFIAATTTNAQTEIRNETDCEYVLRIQYGNVLNCNVQGNLSLVLQPMATTVLPISDDQGIITMKGAYNSSSLVNCPFLIGALCSGNPQSQNVSCSIECGDYTVLMNANGSVRFFN